MSSSRSSESSSYSVFCLVLHNMFLLKLSKGFFHTNQSSFKNTPEAKTLQFMDGEVKAQFGILSILYRFGQSWLCCIYPHEKKKISDCYCYLLVFIGECCRHCCAIIVEPLCDKSVRQLFHTAL